MVEDNSKKISAVDKRIDLIQEDIDKNAEEIKVNKEEIQEIQEKIQEIQEKIGLEEEDDTATDIELLGKLSGNKEDILYKNIRRALKIWENFEQWSERVPVGRKLDTQTVLDRMEEENLTAKQIHRSMEELCKLSEEKYETETDSKGKRIIIRRRE